MENIIHVENKLKLSLYGGAGIGLLFGVMMGTSINPTVATLFGTLTTLLAAILGLNDAYFTNAKAVRVGSFGFACVIGAYLGLFVRSHDVFSPSLFTLKENYIALGFSEKQALSFVALKEFDILIQTNEVESSQNELIKKESSTKKEMSDENTKINNRGMTPLVMNSRVSKQHSSVLFSAPVELSSCDEVERTDNSLPLDEVLNNFELTGGVWEELVIKVSSEIEQDKQKLILLTIKDAVCQIDAVEEADCKALDPIIAQTHYQAVFAAVKNYNKSWHIVASAIEGSSLLEGDKLHSLRLAKNTLCGF